MKRSWELYKQEASDVRDRVLPSLHEGVSPEKQVKGAPKAVAQEAVGKARSGAGASSSKGGAAALTPGGSAAAEVDNLVAEAIGWSGSPAGGSSEDGKAVSPGASTRKVVEASKRNRTKEVRCYR